MKKKKSLKNLKLILVLLRKIPENEKSAGNIRPIVYTKTNTFLFLTLKIIQSYRYIA